MTAPTHPEPRPDDEGRETEAYDGHPFRCPKCNGPLTSVLGEESSCKACRALTPHPAPLGATRSMTPEEVESQKQFRRSISRPLGATDEGLRAAAIGRALLAALATLPYGEELRIEHSGGRWIAYPTIHFGATCHASPEGRALSKLLGPTGAPR